MNQQLAAWTGKFGDDYTARQPEDAEARTRMWETIFEDIYLPDNNFTFSIMEVGANSGKNLYAYPYGGDLYGVEPNEAARAGWEEGGIRAVADTATNIKCSDGLCDIVFTCGVLIHIPPKDLLKACSEIVRVSNRYVLAIEYFAAEPIEKKYRGQHNLMWKRDFGAFYMDNFPELKYVSSGFFWKRTTGLDNLTWWLFEK